jgi:predicted SprT family Zn-dependent metalloprotease
MANKPVSCGNMADEKNPIYFTCKCGKDGIMDKGISAENRYPCQKCLDKMNEKIKARYGRKGAKK